MQRIILILIMFVLFLPQTVLAASGISGNVPEPETASAIKLPALKNDNLTAKLLHGEKTEITSVRYAVHNDAVTGDAKLRLVIDATGPVSGNAVLKNLPAPCLEITIPGASLTSGIGALWELDGNIANQAKFLQVNGASKLIINLENMIDDSDYRVFALQRDIRADKPYRVVIDINKPTPPVNYKFTSGLKGKKIAIDPGHGGSDPGAIGPGGTTEKTVTLAVAQKLEALLQKAGAKVIMTRRTDSDVYGVNASAVDELKARTTVGTVNKADVFISIHADAFSNPTAGGTSTFYYRKSMYDVMLAQNIQTSIVQAGNLTDRRANPANFYVIKRSLMPAALVELAFITNPNEEKLLNSPQFQQKMAQGIYQGLENFFAQAAKYGGGQ